MTSYARILSGPAPPSNTPQPQVPAADLCDSVGSSATPLSNTPPPTPRLQHPRLRNDQLRLHLVRPGIMVLKRLGPPTPRNHKSRLRRCSRRGGCRGPRASNTPQPQVQAAEQRTLRGRRCRCAPLQHPATTSPGCGHQSDARLDESALDLPSNTPQPQVQAAEMASRDWASSPTTVPILQHPATTSPGCGHATRPGDPLLGGLQHPATTSPGCGQHLHLRGTSMTPALQHPATTSPGCGSPGRHPRAAGRPAPTPRNHKSRLRRPSPTRRPSTSRRSNTPQPQVQAAEAPFRAIALSALSSKYSNGQQEGPTSSQS